MSIRNIEASKIAPRKLSYSPVPVTTEWVRNKAWPVLAEPSSSEQKLVGLYAVFPGDGTGTGGNWFAVTFFGAYTVDFGDGTSVNTAAGAQTNKSYDFNNVNLYDATVTFTDSGDLVTRNSHGYTDGDTVSFYRIQSTTGIFEGQVYYVINSTINTFQISATSGGSAINLTTNGSASLLPYKIATVTITSQAGQNLTSVNLAVKHNQTGLQNYSTGWLDISLSVPNATTITIGINSIYNGILERFNLIAAGNFTSCANWFVNNRRLKRVIIPFNATAAVSNMSNMFQNCSSLTSVPLFNTAAVTSMSQMFSGCSSLTSVPLFNTAAVTTMGQMFNGCSSLTSVPLFNTAAVFNMSNMFNGCSSLTSVPAFVTTAVNSAGSFSFMFTSCLSLSRIEAKDFRFTFSVANCNLSATALNEIYTNLPVVTGQTITVSGNYGTTGDNPAIATAKGWTVTG
jgi:surface protein